MFRHGDLMTPSLSLSISFFLSQLAVEETCYNKSEVAHQAKVYCRTLRGIRQHSIDEYGGNVYG